ncbi:hypothetical protein [Bacillus sp. AFS031507]|uniref:hypothetical protein n=1 Tax=Bacillus sp. AFS031507 TaxID=2033496 RepID=UPI000BFB9517|nr:hypothetical protein [Bacillus sp. AFS031507]PGY01635.1 hypothetical protein COE25_30105 [Bacillus sp. AFS031507]
MKKIIFIVLFLLITVGTSGNASANQSNTPRPFEEIYLEIGYQSVETAIKAFEHHFKQDVKLPLRQPPVAFTHQFGRFSNLEGNINDSFEVKYINDRILENHYKIDIRPLKNKLVFKDRGNQKVYKLQNGQKAIYMVDRLFNFFVFEKDNWQYMLGMDKRLANAVPPDVS